MNKGSNNFSFEKVLISLIKSSDIRILGVNIKWLDNYMNVSIMITSLFGATIGLIIGLLFNNILNGLFIGSIIGTIFGIYIGFKINKNYIKKR